MCDSSQVRVTVTLNQAAEQLATTPMNILMHLKHKLIVGVEENGAWSICQQSLHEFQQKNQRADKTLCKKHNCQHSQCGSCS